MLALAISVAMADFVVFAAERRQLWTAGAHDRNFHYLFALELSADLRHGRLLDLLRQLNGARIWPPLHGMLAALAVLAGGRDVRVAVLPNLASWVGLVVLAFLTARRAVPRGGSLAGLTAASFVLASGAHRAFATDLMLEPLGAFLTLVVLHAYLRAVEEPARPGRGRWLGASLTLLFLQKYNYWALVLVALAAERFLESPREWLALARSSVRGADFGKVVSRARLRSPLDLALGATLVVLVLITIRGARPLVLGDVSIRVYPPYNVVQVAYALGFLRLLLWWRASGRAWVATLDPRLGEVIRWHAVPVAVYMLLPKHVGYFLWYLGTGHGPTGGDVTRLASLARYLAWARTDYHAAGWCAGLALAFLLVCVAGVGRLRRGGAAPLLLVGLATVLVTGHPNQKARFLHSWMPAAWVCAGAGLAHLVHGSRSRLAASLRPALTGLLASGMAVALVPILRQSPRAQEGGPRDAVPSLLDVADSYLPALQGSRRAAVFSEVASFPFVQWTALERLGTLDRLEKVRWGFGAQGEPNRRGFLEWLATTDCDTLIRIERLPGAFPWEVVGETALHSELGDLLRGQRRFPIVRRQVFPLHACAVSVFRRSGHSSGFFSQVP